jgi:DNA-binding NarL/FixJ family response regulator
VTTDASSAPTADTVLIHGHNGTAQRLIDALEAVDIHAEMTEELDSIVSSGGRAVIMSIDSDEALEAVIDLRDSSWDMVVITLTPDDSEGAYRKALKAGANAAAPKDAPIEDIVDVIRSALGGRSVLPSGVARRLALEAPDIPDAHAPSLEEIGWVQAMAEGRTLADIAEGSGMAKGELTKRLNALYELIDADNRTEAIIKFARWGLLD